MMTNTTTRWSALLILGLSWSVGACVQEHGAAVEKAPPIEPVLSAGKADVADRVTHMGPLEFGEAAEGVFGEDLEFHAYRVWTVETSVLSLEVTHKGSSMGLDTSMFLFGPEKGGSFGESAIAIDDDSGYGRLSKLEGISLEAGQYLLVIGTATGTGRGRYRVLVECAEGDCKGSLSDFLDEDRETPRVTLTQAPGSPAIDALLEEKAAQCILHCDMRAIVFTYTPSSVGVVAVSNALMSQYLDNTLDWFNEGALGDGWLREELDRSGLGEIVGLSQALAGDEDHGIGWLWADSQPHPDFRAYHEVFVLAFPETGFGVAIEIVEIFD